MLVTNCIFRVGCAAALITNDPSCRRVAKMELVQSLRSHHGASDRAYKAAFQEEDEKGNLGFALTKDLIPVAGTYLREHIKILAPRVLPLSQLAAWGRVLRLGDELTEPARMSLHRFGNTSSSLVFYELAYFEAKERVKKGDRVWMLAFGTGFKVGSLVWKSLSDLGQQSDNPWDDCIHNYPLSHSKV
ncbi:hypothetical protein M0R45_009326 [Rubus argutus]|uniref:very-long-chain 3-oxoacyl-CoA synthase n=1 Tax=Rubus argutus TaxID=59490 RepID=A0AAW1Y6P6_RUBAR